MVVFGAKKCRNLSRSCKKTRPILKGCSIVAVAIVIAPAVFELSKNIRMEEKDRSMCKETKLCEECKSNPWKYKCPGCSIRSCSLPCVKGHKQRTGCSGKRNQTQFVPISQFDDNLLLSGKLKSLVCL